MHLMRLSLCLALSSALAGPSVEKTGSQEQYPRQNQTADQQPAPKDAAKDAQTATPSSDQSIEKDEITAVPNRPTFATTAETVQRGVFEIEYGFELAKGHQNINGLLKWGMFQNLELWFLNIAIERDSGVAGRGDSGAGFKYKMMAQSKAVPTLSILYLASLPTATAEVGSGAMGHSVQLLVSKDLGQHHFDINEGVQFVGRPSAAGFDHNYFSSFSYSHPIAGKWGWTAELAGFSWTNTSAPATMTLLGAGTYNMSSRLVLDGGAYLAVYGNLPRVTFFSGVTYSVADLYRRRTSRRPTRH
jgi:hypothetical protein